MKPLAAFGSNRSQPDGLSVRCRSCTRTRQAIYNHTPARQEWMRAYARRPEVRERQRQKDGARDRRAYYAERERTLPRRLKRARRLALGRLRRAPTPKQRKRASQAVQLIERELGRLAPRKERKAVDLGGQHA